MPSTKLPALYSFRRCPYAIRARLAIRYAQIRVEIREILLKNKPDCLLKHSPKGTVPVLLLQDNQVIEESLDIIQWALSIQDRDNWRLQGLGNARNLADQLIQQNDTSFKQALDRYKYADRYPDCPASHYRSLAETFIDKLERRLTQTPYLVSQHLSIADIAIVPFVRQFAHVDKEWFEQTPYNATKSWLNSLLDSDLFITVMNKYSPWTGEQREIF